MIDRRSWLVLTLKEFVDLMNERFAKELPAGATLREVLDIHFKRMEDTVLVGVAYEVPAPGDKSA